MIFIYKKGDNNMGDVKTIRWWKYKSFLKFFGIGIGVVILSLISALLIPDAWCLCAILPICGVGGYFMRKLIPDVLMDLKKELER